MTQARHDISPEILELQSRLGASARPLEPLARHASVRIGGTADLFFVARAPAQLVDAVEAASRLGIPWRAIGGASNLLIADDGVEGLVIKVASSGIEELQEPVDEGILLRIQAGATLAAAGKQLAKRGLAGLEWATNVPGTVGASVVNNSGAFGSCIADHLESARVHQAGRGAATYSPSDLDLGYRTSRLKRREMIGIVTEATFRLTRADPAALQAQIAEIQKTRRATQPAGYSVGSVFANPPGDSAGRLIESVGLKGLAAGDAQISTLHANFIVNRGAARASDVIQLIKLAQHTVWTRAGVWLTPEVQLAGRFASDEIAGLTAPPGEAA